ncbi:MAG: hypothetical protein H5T42_00010 [Methanothrix sp.]|uniref:hypothetical protein n=1 Tax=Methanothrix sp. TaxID=90426 RepID=UPI00198CB4D6|nr:hypothetical protein [Methanothrix sp.]MBC7078855.1 hypothetical protein [Methanothrix sp.]NPU87018.1 hypothetical protein [Methanothrix sp.]
MKKYVMCMAALAVLCAAGIALAANGSDEPVAKGDGNLTLSAWNSFVENLNYSSVVLNQSIHGNISRRDAMVLMTTLLTLNSQTLAELEALETDEKYADFQNYTIGAMRTFNGYLFNMAKFFETDEVIYVIRAREWFNASQEYYTKGKEEAEFIF